VQVRRADEGGRPFGLVSKLLAARINRSRTLFKPKHKLVRLRFYERAASLLIRYQNLQIEATPKFAPAARCLGHRRSHLSRQMRGHQKQREREQATLSSVSSFNASVITRNTTLNICIESVAAPFLFRQLVRAAYR
jgi:hypothetical protein